VLASSAQPPASVTNLFPVIFGVKFCCYAGRSLEGRTESHMEAAHYLKIDIRMLLLQLMIYALIHTKVKAIPITKKDLNLAFFYP
jgi:hypothetical protein